MSVCIYEGEKKNKGERDCKITGGKGDQETSQ